MVKREMCLLQMSLVVFLIWTASLSAGADDVVTETGTQENLPDQTVTLDNGGSVAGGVESSSTGYAATDSSPSTAGAYQPNYSASQTMPASGTAATAAPPVVTASGSTPPSSPLETAPPTQPIQTKGKLGFGVGLEKSVTSFEDVGGNLSLRAWVGDRFALEPSFSFAADIHDGDTTIGVMPGIDFLFSIYKGRATRVHFGFGFGFGYYTSIEEASEVDENLDDSYDSSSDAYEDDSDETSSSSDSSLGFVLPLVLQLEHFFSESISIYVGARFNLLSVGVDGVGDSNSDVTVRLAIDTTALNLGLIFYTF